MKNKFFNWCKIIAIERQASIFNVDISIINENSNNSFTCDVKNSKWLNFKEID